MKTFRYILLCFFMFGAGALACLSVEEPAPFWLLLDQDAARHFYFSRPEFDAPRAEQDRPRDTLLALVDAARDRVEVWCYGLDEPDFLAALARAKRRGVTVVMTGDPETDYSEALAAGLQVAPRRRTGIQHVKLVLVDRRLLFAGTGNFTTSDFYFSHNGFFHLVLDRTTADAIARALEFEADSGGPIPLPFQGRMFFAPRQGRLIQSELVRAVLGARTSIRFLIFSHSDPVLTAALFIKQRAGVIVEGVYNDEFSRQKFEPDSEGARLNEALGLAPSALYLDGNFRLYEKRPGELHGGNLHHKTLIVDDQAVYTGSYNWSLGARDRNLEVFFEFQSRAVTAEFTREFDRIRARALLQPRTAFPPGLDTDGPALLRDGRSFCPPAGTPVSFTVFAGRGPYFRAEHFRPGTGARAPVDLETPFGTRPCFDPDDADDRSAGLPGDSDFALPIPESFQANSGSRAEPGAYELGLRAWRLDVPADGLPCEVETCSFFTPRDVQPSGWLWLDPTPVTARLVALRVWSRAGMSATIALRQTAPGFYTFSPVEFSGDLIFFATDEAGATRVACVRGGTTMDPRPRFFLEALGAENGSVAECLARD